MKNRFYQQQTTKKSGWLRPKTEFQYEELFGLTFGVAFVLTSLLTPFLFLGFNGLLFLPFSVMFGIATLIKAMIIAAVVFFSLFSVVAIFLPRALSYVATATLTAFLSASVGLITRIGFFPPSLAFDLDGWEAAAIIGAIAATFAFFVSSFLAGSVR